ncbi:hypothetical protein [Haploplasma axanthum]|uniref:Uncharacterized protein n=1 Tax=Haploplasma axanthum TaxID=29552 RepID=A0A449BCP2_HAPAX|nr:hypothetical protein [Haploplasma axanthum]VEU80214.1 Uncharacterised protein [Haploplasma axanthum]
MKDFEYDIHNGYNYYGKELTDNSVINNIEMEKISKYDGTNSGGYITDLPKYVADRYGKEYKLNVSKRVTNMDGELQTDNSIYYESKNGFSYSEGNCGLISAFNYLKYMYNNRGFSRIPYSSKIKYDASILEPKIYDKKLKDSNYTVRNNKNISKALSDIRQEAYRINGGPEGLTVWESRKLLDYAMKEYGYSTRFKVIEIWDYNTVTSRIDKGQGLLWSVFGHQTYGSHTMFVSGYNTYVKTGKFLWWTTYSYKEFFILKDGHYKTDKFYDFNGFNGGVVVGGFVVEK